MKTAMCPTTLPSIERRTFLNHRPFSPWRRVQRDTKKKPPGPLIMQPIKNIKTHLANLRNKLLFFLKTKIHPHNPSCRDLVVDVRKSSDSESFFALFQRGSVLKSSSKHEKKLSLTVFSSIFFFHSIFFYVLLVICKPREQFTRYKNKSWWK